MAQALIHLASASPRRKLLLEQLGLRFEVVSAEVDETRRLGEAPGDYVLRLARAKAEAGALRLAVLAARVLGADTAVVLGAEVLGKPRDRADALAMLAKLSGRSHQVLSAVALWHQGLLSTALCESRVTFRPIAPAEAEAYWESGEPRDKAGAYGIQGLGGAFVEHLEGSYSGVMGLPLFETTELLRRTGVGVF